MDQIEHLKANKLDKDALDDLWNKIRELERIIQEKLNQGPTIIKEEV